MLEGKLDKDMVADTAICDMLVRVSAGRVDVAVYSVVSDNSLVYRSFAVSSPASLLKTLEEVVYDNPLMLCEFRKVHILVDTLDYMMIPASTGEADAREMFMTMHPGYDGTVELCDTSTRNAVVVYGIDRDLSGFLHRTFVGATVMPHILPLTRYFSSKPGRGNSRRMICNFRQSAMDIVVLDGNSMLQANTFTFRAPMDAVYYILASRSLHGLDPYGDELLLAGDQQLREEVAPVLRTYISRVMPALFPPQMFRAGKEAMKAPFDMVVAPLCE